MVRAFLMYRARSDEGGPTMDGDLDGKAAQGAAGEGQGGLGHAEQHRSDQELHDHPRPRVPEGATSSCLNSPARMARAGRNAKEIMIPKISVTGVSDYTRNVGAVDNESSRRR